jgi:hypothetical protein
VFAYGAAFILFKLSILSHVVVGNPEAIPTPALPTVVLADACAMEIHFDDRHDLLALRSVLVADFLAFTIHFENVVLNLDYCSCPHSMTIFFHKIIELKYSLKSPQICHNHYF